jgi:hypothetical protein
MWARRVRLIFISGMPATGKLTVAGDLASKTGFKLFHNHLVVDLLLSVFEFGSPEFVRLREEIWLSVMKDACSAGLTGLIFTFAPERTVRPGFVSDVEKAILEANGRLDFVELVCPLVELTRRMGNESRTAFGKLASVELFEQLLANGVFDAPEMPRAAVIIDTSTSSPIEAADQIVWALGLAL